MQKILMILTSHRLDCLKLALHCLEQANAYQHFDRVVFLLNGVVGDHLDFIARYRSLHPDVSWDAIAGPRGRSECISSLENQCIRKYPNGLYIKIDEDVFVGEGWAERMIRAYDDQRDKNTLALITPLIPNNAYGLYALCHNIYPEAGSEFRDHFGYDVSPLIDGPTWRLPSVAEWATRRFININDLNSELPSRAVNPSVYTHFTERFSIGCICFDYGHWQRMGEIPPKDEPEWCAWIEHHGEHNVLINDHIVLHYSFFVQQDWLDRTTLLEDISIEFGLMKSGNNFTRHFPRLKRLSAQIPSIIRRRLGFVAN
jgi:hypothetical protein